MLYDRALQPAGLNSSQFSALRNIPVCAARHHRACQGHAAQRTTLTRNLELLKAQGLLELRGSTADARIFTPVLTSRGVETLKAAAPRWRFAQRRFFGGLGASGWADCSRRYAQPRAINEQAPQRLYVGSADAVAAGVEEGPAIDLLDTQRCANRYSPGRRPLCHQGIRWRIKGGRPQSTQLHVLAASIENPQCRPLDLATLLSLDQASITLTLSSMRRAGWVEATRGLGNASDKPGPQGVSSGPEGRAILSKALPVSGARRNWPSFATGRAGRS